jgi:hypothetical protein
MQERYRLPRPPAVGVGAICVIDKIRQYGDLK